MISSRYSFKHELLFCFFIILAILAIYSQVINHEFVSFDDLDYVVANYHVQKGITLEGVKWAFSVDRVDSTYWHPLTWLSHMTDVAMFGNQAGFHLLVNMVWHILNTCLLFMLLHRATRMFWLSVLTATCFAVHPLNVETVAWIAERKNLLSTFFGLLTIATYIYYSRSQSIKRYMLLFAIFVTGLMTKPMLVTLPFVLLLLDYWPLERISMQSSPSETSVFHFSNFIKQIVCRLLEKIPLILTSIIVLRLVTKSASTSDIFIDFVTVPLSLRIENILVSYALYLFKFLWPIDLACYYPFPKFIPHEQVVISAILLIFITFIAISQVRIRKYFIVGWLWFVGTLVPVSGLVQAGLWPAMADRWVYVPYIGLFIIFSGVFLEIFNRLKIVDIFMCFIVVFVSFVFGTISWQQVKHWQNSNTLFNHALSVTENNHVAHNNLGVALVENGHIDEAIEHFYQAIKIDPFYFDARVNLTILLAKRGKNEEASRIYEEGIQLQSNAFEGMSKSDNISGDNEKKVHEEAVAHFSSYLIRQPKDIEALYRLADELTQLGRIEEAIENYSKIVIIDPDHYKSYNNLAMLFDMQGKNDSAILNFNKALTIAPENSEIHYNLALTLAKYGQLDAAEKHFLKALYIDPTFVYAHNNLGILLAQQGQAEKAVSHFKKALQYDSSSVDAHTNLGVILYKLGRVSEARYHFQEAVKLNPEDRNLRKMLYSVTPNNEKNSISY